MYSINTQLAYFNYSLDSKRMLVNITWFKLEVLTDSKIRGAAFSDFEIEVLKEYIEANKSNFPGAFFIDQIRRGEENVFTINSPGTSPFPIGLILSKSNTWRSDTDIIYKIMEVSLTDENYQQEKTYDLNFDLVGRVNVYKEIKR